MLNAGLDREALAEEYRRDGRVRIENVLDPDVAERIRSICLTDVPYKFVTHVDGRNITLSSEEMAALEPPRFRELQGKILDAAAKGIGFSYSGYLMAQKVDAPDNENRRFLHSVFEYMNGDEMLAFVSAVTGATDLRSADAQFTRYTPGQFLTRHRDDITSEQRRVAYVVSFSRNWHPDWGGLLQFFEDDGTPRDAWAPKFNTMSLFDVRHVHSVTFVAPFALEQRLSLTGWFRARPW